jgi:hypothetical protein
MDRPNSRETPGAGCAAAARRGAHAVRLVHRRPSGADKSGRRRARAEECREDRQDAGARGRRVAQTRRQHPDRDRARPTRPRFDRHPHLLLRPHLRGARHEGGGSTPTDHRVERKGVLPAMGSGGGVQSRPGPGAAAGSAEPVVAPPAMPGVPYINDPIGVCTQGAADLDIRDLAITVPMSIVASTSPTEPRQGHHV